MNLEVFTEILIDMLLLYFMPLLIVAFIILNTIKLLIFPPKDDLKINKDEKAKMVSGRNKPRPKYNE